jgi:predicted DNA-binding protein (MmcQ/YjbR family)
MRLASLRQSALSLPGTSVVNQWGGEVVKVAGKVFLVLSVEAETLDGVAFKCTPEEFDELTAIDGIDQAPYFAKRHWVRVSDLTALSADELLRRIKRSHALVVAKLPKAVRAGLL